MGSCRQFFKIVLQTSLDDRKLMLPRKFISEYGEGLSGPVSLKLPNNDVEWRVELTTSDNGLVWLHKGWHEFAEYVSLEHGSFLVFRYDGNSNFLVTIFDSTGLEIEYPCKDTNGWKYKAGRIHDPIEILDDLPQECQKKRKPALPHYQSSKKTRMEDLHTPKLELEEEPDIVEKGYEGLDDSKRRSKHEAARRREPLTAAAKVEALQSSDASESEIRTCTVVLQKSYLQRRDSLVIPIAFARKHFPERRGNLDLQVPDGRTWSLRYTWYCSGRYASITGGWTKFASENGLKKGDVCVFELIQPTKLLFTKQQDSSLSKDKKLELEKSEQNNNVVNANVEVEPSNTYSAREGIRKETDFDWIEVPSKSKRSNNFNASKLTEASSSSKNSKAASDFIPKKPFFEMVMRYCDIKRGCLNIPVSFGREHFSDSPKQVVKLFNGRRRMWKVNLLKYVNRFRISAGWRSFIKGNSLVKGDTCIFEIISNNPLSLKVTIFNRMGFLKCKY